VSTDRVMVMERGATLMIGAPSRQCTHSQGSKAAVLAACFQAIQCSTEPYLSGGDKVKACEK